MSNDRTGDFASSPAGQAGGDPTPAAPLSRIDPTRASPPPGGPILQGSLLGRAAAWLTRWPIALAICAGLAAVVVLPGLGGPGLWEPQERQLADRIAPPKPSASPTAPVVPAPVRPADRGDKPADDCVRTTPPDAAARTLTARAIPWGQRSITDSDTGRRLPLAALGILTVLAAAATAIRLAGARAGVITAIVLLAMPLLALQSRMLTSEIGTACGASLVVYGLVAFGELRRGRALLDGAVAAIGLAAGIVLGFYGGGALLGLAVPLGAVAAAGGFGLGVFVRRAPAPTASWIPAAIATIAVIGVVGLLAYQIYDLKTPYPGMTPPPARQVLGKAIVPSGCYAWALGGLWRPEDDLRMIYDSTFEQIAYGTFPWGLLAPIAMAGLLASGVPRLRRAGALTLAWGGAAWVAGEVFQRKVGFTVFAGFPALAIAVGAWLDDVLARRGGVGLGAAGARLVAVFAGLGMLDLAKDMQSFAERVTSLLIGNDAVTYPTQSRLVWIPTKGWIVIFAAAIVIAAVLALAPWRDTDDPRGRALRRLANRAAIAALVMTLGLGVFWSQLWQPRLALHLSSKAMFDTYDALARPGEPLVIMGDLGQAPAAYAAPPPQQVSDRSAVIAALSRPERVFAIAPQSELCTLHREIGGKPYFVVDDRNLRSLLLSNKVDGTTDRNPLRTAIVHEPPATIPYRPRARVVWDGRIELLGWDMPRAIRRGARFEVTLYYKILQPVGGAWRTLVHFDGAAGRAGNGDHEPIGGRCPTSTWQQGDYIIDRFTTSAGGAAFPGGGYDVWLGFFTGQAPNWRNMPISEAPGDMRDNADRVKITRLVLE